MGCAFRSERQLRLPTCKTTCLLSLLDFSSLKAGAWGEPESPAGIRGPLRLVGVCVPGVRVTLTCLCPQLVTPACCQGRES